jgi:hypothetical protein
MGIDARFWRTTTLTVIALLVLVDWAAAQDTTGAPDSTAQNAKVTTTVSDSTAISEAKADSIRTLIQLTRARRLTKQMVNRTLRAQRQQHPEVPDEWWREFRSRIDTEGLVDLYIPIYARHFSQQEINQLLTFYRSPVGQKVVQEMPAVMREAMSAGRQWGRKVAKKVVEQLREDGYAETEN